jgi:hypothetical protein
LKEVLGERTVCDIDVSQQLAFCVGSWLGGDTWRIINE